MATRPNPYLKKDPGDIMLAADWNEMQVQSREELRSHGHSGGADANPIARAGIAPGAVDGTRIDPQSEVALKALKVNGRVLLEEIDKLMGLVGGLATSKADRAGDAIAGPLSVQKDLQVAGNAGVTGSLATGALTVKGTFSLKTFSSDDKDEPSLFVWSQDYGKNWDEQVLKHSAAKGMFGRAGFGIHMDGTREWGIWSSGWTALLAVEGGTGRVKTRGDVLVGGTLAWGNSLLLAEQGGSIELGGSNTLAGTGTPFIDFHFKGKQEDFNVRLINDADKQLSIFGNLQVVGVMRSSAVSVDPGVADHLVIDGSFYRWGGQVYINVDDNLYIRDSTRGIRMHFDTTNGIFKTDKLRLGDRWVMSGVGDGQANDDWLRLVNAGNPAAYYGGLAAGRLWTAQGVLAGSDLRLKHDIATIDGALAKVGALRGVTYLLNDAPEHGEQAGLVAQEVEAVFPQVVSDGPDGMKGVNYNGMIGLLVEAIKEQQTQIDALRAETRNPRKPQ